MSADLPGPDHGELQELLGAYALDAVDAETAVLVERHLETCPRCSVEVAHHHEVAGLLGNTGGESPPEVWDGIAARLAGSAPPSWERLAARLGTGPPPGPGRPDPSVRPGRRWVTAAAVGVAAAAVAVAIGLGVRVHHLDHQVSALTSTPGLTAAERAALTEPSTRRVELTAPPGRGAPVTVSVVLTTSGTGFVQAHTLPVLASDRTYQLWAVVGGQIISLGLLGPDPGVVAFSAAGGPSVHAFAITDEQAGGVVQSNASPVVAGRVGA